MQLASKATKILVLGDEPRMLQTLVDVIRLKGYRTDFAQGERDAIQRLTDSGYDLIILDLFAKTANAYSTLISKLQRVSNIALIIIANKSFAKSSIKALRHHAVDIVRKPYQPENLFKTIENLLNHMPLEKKTQVAPLTFEKSEDWYCYLVENSPDIIYSLDENGCFKFTSNRIETVLGYSSTQLIGKHYSTLIHEDDISKAKCVFDERRTGTRAFNSIELRLKLEPQKAAQNKKKFIVVELNAAGIYRDNGAAKRLFVGTHGVAKDISGRKHIEESLSHQVYHDALTGLPNLLLLTDRLNVAIAQARRAQQKLAVIFIDLDRFGFINDTIGKVNADQVMQEIAHRLQKCVREGDTVARSTDDEFFVILPQLTIPEGAAYTARKILSVLSRPSLVVDSNIQISASIGIAMYPEDGETADTLIRNAEMTAYHVKSRERANYAFFGHLKGSKQLDRSSLESDLRKAVTNNELELYYQPQVSTETGIIVAMEALVRWNHPWRGMIYPGEFIALAEQTGIMASIGEWVLTTACNQLEKWRKAGAAAIRISVNLSTYQIEQNNFLDTITQLVQQMSGRMQLEIEIAESDIMKDIEKTQEKLQQLATLGVKISLDDFGVGFSSLSYLKNLPVHAIKIDQSFIHDITVSGTNASVLTAMIQIAKGLKLKLIAEGVETNDQLAFLRDSDCEECQGFLFSRPINTSEATRILIDNKPLHPTPSPQALIN